MYQIVPPDKGGLGGLKSHKTIFFGEQDLTCKIVLLATSYTLKSNPCNARRITYNAKLSDLSTSICHSDRSGGIPLNLTKPSIPDRLHVIRYTLHLNGYTLHVIRYT